MNLIRIIFFFVAYSSFNLYGQFAENIRTGRPGQAIGPFTVGSSVFQVQIGTDFGGDQDNLNKSTESYQSTGGVFRFGLMEKVEVSGSLNYQLDKTELEDSIYSNSSIGNFGLGIRNNIFVGKGVLPSVGVQFDIKLPATDKKYQFNNFSPKITLMTGQNLSPKFSFTSNWGISWHGNNTKPTGLYILNLGYSITDKIGTFVECYGVIQNQNLKSRVSSNSNTVAQLPRYYLELISVFGLVLFIISMLYQDKDILNNNHNF